MKPDRQSRVNGFYILPAAVLIAFIGMGCPLQQVAAGVIDSFSTVAGGDPDSVSISGAAFGTPVTFYTSPPNNDPVGNERRLTVSQFAQNESASLTVDGTGVALLQQSGNATSSWTINYGVTVIGGLHYDATAGGADRFRLVFDVPSGNLEYVIGVYGYTATGTSHGGTYQPLGGIVEAPFSSFSNSGLINFADINQLDIRIRNAGLTRGGNASLTLFETNGMTAAPVPEPGTFALAFVALFAILLVRGKIAIG